MRRKAKHIPRSGYAFALNGRAYCGRYAEYATGDHALIYKQATVNPQRYCKQCLSRFRRVFKGQAAAVPVEPREILRTADFIHQGS